MRGRSLLVTLLALSTVSLAPLADGAPADATTIWSGSGSGGSHWEQGYLESDGSIMVTQLGLDMEYCYEAAGHGSFIFQQFEVSTPQIGFRATGVGHVERQESGLLITTEATGTVVDQGMVSEPVVDGCGGGESWIRFGEPVGLQHFTYRLGFQGVATWNAAAWVVTVDGETLPAPVHESGSGTFLLTHEDLTGGDEVRTPGVTASLRQGATGSITLETGPQALLFTYFDNFAQYHFTAPDGTTCDILDSDATGYSQGDCGRFSSGSGAGTYTVDLVRRAGLGRGAFLWAGIDAPSMPSIF